MTEKLLEFSAHMPINEAIDRAKHAKMPLLLPVETYQDDRGWSFMNLAYGLSSFGQMNFSCMQPGVIKAWHKHENQTDIWVVVRGDLKVGVIHEFEVSEGIDHKAWYAVIGEHKPGIIIIPPGLWHGCTVNTKKVAGLVYITDKIYNPGTPDEQRRKFDYFGPLFSWGVENR